MSDTTSSEKKTVADLERERGLLLVNLGNWELSTLVSEEEFSERVAANMHDWVGVDFDSREEFLKSNGYELTRNNLIDSSLSAGKLG